MRIYWFKINYTWAFAIESQGEKQRRERWGEEESVKNEAPLMLSFLNQCELRFVREFSLINDCWKREIWK